MEPRVGCRAPRGQLCWINPLRLERRDNRDGNGITGVIHRVDPQDEAFCPAGLSEAQADGDKDRAAARNVS